MKAMILGINGMAGHVMGIYMMEQGVDVIGFARKKNPVCNTIVGDALDATLVKQTIYSERPDVVVNCIGILNKAVDNDLETGIYLNSYFPHFVANCCDTIGAKLIHISSDCVFSGKASGYTEKSVPDETSYYGRTKFLGEVTGGLHLSIRTSIVGPELKDSGIGLFNWFMHNHTEVPGFAHVMWSGVTTIELAKAVLEFVNRNVSGLYFLTNGIGISKYDLLNLFNSICRVNPIEIKRCEEPVNSKVLICTRKDVEYEVPSYEHMIRDMNEWIQAHRELYGQYLSV